MVFELNDDESFLRFIDGIVESWGRAVVPFFAGSEKSKTAAFGFGSGFLIVRNGRCYLATALHVVEEMIRCGVCVTSIAGKGMAVEHLEFTFDQANDLAVVAIDRFLQEKGVGSIFPINLDSEPCSGEPTGLHLLMGYPASKNKLDTKWNKVDRMLFSITAEQSDGKGINTPIANALFFAFEPKKMVNSQAVRADNPPDLYGMSGGPVLALFSEQTPVGINFGVRFCGVLVEWHSRHRAIVAAKKEDLIRLIDSIGL